MAAAQSHDTDKSSSARLSVFTESARAIKEILSLPNAEQKAEGNISALTAQIDLLAKVETPPTVEELRKSQIGRTVGSIQRSSPVTACREKARVLVERWRSNVQGSTKRQASQREEEKEKSKGAVDDVTPSTGDTGKSKRRRTASKSETQAPARTERERLSVLSKLKQILGSDKSASSRTEEKQMIIDRASSECEEELWSQRHSDAGGTASVAAGKAAYMNQARAVLFNLKKNTKLRDKVLSGTVNGRELAQMTTDDMMSSSQQERREESKAYFAEAAQFNGESANKVRTNLFKCEQCGSNDTEHYLLQVEKADEAMSEFHTCLSCGAGWRVN